MRIIWWHIKGMLLTLRWWLHLPQREVSSSVIPYGVRQGFEHFYCSACRDHFRAKWVLAEHGNWTHGPEAARLRMRGHDVPESPPVMDLVVEARCPAALAFGEHIRRRP